MPPLILKGLKPASQHSIPQDIAVLALLCGIFCVTGNVSASKMMGIIFAVLGLVALIYQQIANDTFGTFDCLAMCFGVAIYYIASKIEE